MDSIEKISCCLSIMRRLPPDQIEQNLSGLINIVPDQVEELLQRIDQPLEVATDSTTGQEYLLCDYNRDGDSYRSPWSNVYEPALDDGFLPSDSLRQLEIQFNDVFSAYMQLYYQGGTSSVYLWDLDDGFAGCFLIKKLVADHRFVREGSWNSIHVIEVIENGNGTATYKLTTTVMLHMAVNKDSVGDSTLSGSLTRQDERTCKYHPDTSPHLGNIGSLLEDMEIRIRSDMDGLYIQKTKEVISSIRRLNAGGPMQGSFHTSMLNEAVLKHGAKRTVDSET